MNVVESFIESFAGCQPHLFPALELHQNSPFQDINERVCVVPVDGIHSAGSVFHHDHQNFLPGSLSFDTSDVTLAS
jgi:hypothetical protein